LYYSVNALPARFDSLLNATIGLSAIAIGFLATAKSILLTLDDQWIVKQLKKTGLYVRLLGYFMAAIYWSFLLALVSASGLLIDFRADGCRHHPAWFSAWALAFVGTGACCYRVIKIFARLIRSNG